MRVLQIMRPQIATQLSSGDADINTRLSAKLLEWWEHERADWDAQVAGDDATGADLWSSMPTVDSKTVARMAPIFEEHLGRPFDVRRIRRGGYACIEDVIQHLVFGR